MNDSVVFRDVLKYSSFVAVAILLVGGVAGFLVAGVPGVISAAIGVGVTLAMSAITVGSIVLASKGSVNLFFGTVLGAWFVKIVLFIGLLLLLRDQPFVQPTVLVVSIVAAVAGTLAVDVIVVLRARMPYTGSSETQPAPAPDAR